MKTIGLFFLCFSLSAGVMNDKIAFHELVYQIRDPETGPEEFRKGLQKIGEYLAMEALQDLKTKDAEVATLTGAVASHRLLDEKPVLITILRAGLPLLLGVQEIFPIPRLDFSQ
jgi:uracil phosphoribosyltransferase